METIFVGTAVVAFGIMMLSLLWPKKREQKKVEPVVNPQLQPQNLRNSQPARSVVDTADDRQLARQLFSALRNK